LNDLNNFGQNTAPQQSALRHSAERLHKGLVKDIQHNGNQQSTLSITTFRITAICHYTESRCAECSNLFIAMLNVIMLGVVMLNVVALTIVLK
jgi:hypothetical protein